MLSRVLSTIGALVVVTGIFKAVALVRLYTRVADFSKYKSDRNSAWALITGSSDGIGYGFVEELLSRGFNVIIHGRNSNRLANKMILLQKEYSDLKIRMVAADAADCSPENLQKVIDSCNNLPGPLTILINNVGGQVTTPRHWPLDQAPTETAIDDMLNANIRFMTLLTARLLPLLKQSKSALIINSGSLGGKIPTPYLTVYAAAKSYVHAFSRCLGAELALEGHDIEVFGSIFGNIETPNNPHPGQEFTVTAREAAEACLNKVGSGEATVLPHWKFWAQFCLFQMLPRSVTKPMANQIMKKRLTEEREEAKKVG